MDQEVATDQSVEDKLTAAYEREEQGKTPSKEPPEDNEPQETEASSEVDEGSEAQESSEDEGFEEAEYEGKQYRLPKELKEALLRQKDYTQKTQDVAEQRRMLEERQNALKAESAFREQHFAKAVEAHTLQQHLQQFAQVNWEKLADENPAEAIKAHAKYVELRDRFAAVKEEMQGLNGQLGQQMAESRQKAQAQCLQELKKDFPDLASPEKGRQLLTQLDEVGRSFGFTSQELGSIADPRMIRVLHAAMQYKKLQAAKPAVEKKLATAKPVQVQASRGSQTTQQTSQLTDLKSRAMKSGKSADMEAFLAARFAKSMR